MTTDTIGQNFGAPVPSPRATLGGLHDRWINELLGEFIPGETKATCSSCAMCAHSSVAVTTIAGTTGFSPDLKCCTFWPVLANYLVGEILGATDESPESLKGREAIRSLIDQDCAVPAGLGVPNRYRILYTAAARADFGRAAALLCPFYVDASGGRCGIWQHRNSVCSTYFCKHDRGAVGEAFWTQLRSCLQIVERILALWCARELGADLAHYLPPLAAGSFSPDDLRRESLTVATQSASTRVAWGDWNTRRATFYSQCHVLTQGMSWADVRAIGGIELHVAAERVEQAFEDMTTARVVHRVTPRPTTVQPIAVDTLLVSTYRFTEPFFMSKALFDALRHASGQNVDAFIDTVKREDRVDVDEKTVAVLVDLGLLEDLGPMSKNPEPGEALLRCESQRSVDDRIR